MIPKVFIPGRRLPYAVAPAVPSTTFFLIVVNIVYAFFETFGVIHIVTQGGPAGATTTLVCKLFYGFIG